MGRTVRVSGAKVALSTASCYPESCTTAFEMAARPRLRRGRGDGLDRPGQPGPATRCGRCPTGSACRCSRSTRRACCSPSGSGRPTRGPSCSKAQAAAERVGAPTVVVHPPFRWQRDYAREFVDGLHRMQNETDVTFAVENMFPWKARSREIAAYLPHWDLLEHDYPATTLDLSHTAVVRLGRAADGRGAGRPAAARAPRRRLRVEQGRAPGAGPRRPAVRGRAGAARERRLHRHAWCSR